MNYAGFWRRLAASMIDALIGMIPGLFITTIFRGGAAGFALGFVIGFLYRPFFESSALQGTPGKALMNISVVTENGERISFKQACIRFFCSYISMVIAYIGYFMQPFTARRQTLHDMIAETVVINNATVNDINYFTAWKDEFKAVVNRL